MRTDLLPFAAVAVLGAVLLALVVRAVRRVGVRRIAVAVAGTIGIVTSAESMWLVAGALGVSGPWRAIPAVLFESAMLATAARARDHFRQHGQVGRFGARMWSFAVAAGVIAALSGSTPATIVLRFAAPLVAAAVVLDEFTDHAKRRDLITWKLGLRRLLVRVGLAEAGARELSEVEWDHRVHRLAVAADRLHHGRARLRRWRRGRLRRLARHADDAMVREVQRRVERVHRIEVSTSPLASAALPTGVDPQVVELCDAVRGQARAARSRVMLQPTVAVGHLGSGRPPVHVLAAKMAAEPAKIPATALPVEPPPGAPEVAEEVASDDEPAPATPRPPRGQEAARRVAKILARKPDLTAAEVARRLGVPERTAARHLSRARAGEQQ